MDSIDAALVELSKSNCKLLSSLEHKIPTELRQNIINLCQPGDNEIERLGVADKQIAKEFSNAVNQLLEQSPYDKNHIIAIGSHGQTIRHQPDQQEPFTLQIGDPNTIAFETGITTVADFRRKDIAAGGQGAPLAPAFHQHIFSSTKTNRAIINIGGISNISFLPADGEATGYDTGPGNVLMDSWIQKNKQQNYDNNGEWAASGKILTELLALMLNDTFFSLNAPKSTGRELFNLAWLNSKIKNKNYKPEDIQSTLLELTAQSINNEVKKLPAMVNEIYICGGGAFNTTLMQRLETIIHPAILASTETLGIRPEWVEACAFAWLAKQTLQQLPSNLPAVTGASKSVVLGAIYYQ